MKFKPGDRIRYNNKNFKFPELMDIITVDFYDFCECRVVFDLTVKTDTIIYLHFNLLKHFDLDISYRNKEAALKLLGLK